jgi:formamidopyrimidine-DNA glycosylase
MPELPEVETIKNGLNDILFKKIIKVTSSGLKLRGELDLKILSSIEGYVFAKIRRRAKFIIIEVEKSNLLLIIHLGMTGKLLLKNSHEFKKEKHDHLTIQFKDSYLVFNDIRRFGMIWLIKAEQELDFFSNYGPEPLSSDFSGDYLFKALTNKKAPIKSAIMDNTIVVGVGNIYACESLFKARINPLTPSNILTMEQCNHLVKEIIVTLEEAIKAGGSSLKDYVKSDGSTGYFQHNFLVYGRAGKNCVKCSSVIEKIKIAGRSSFFCPNCQKLDIV